MLQNEPQEETQNAPSIPAAQRRVTADELNAALSALESRKQEEAKQGRETVEIGAVVQELGIDLTPDEIWQQVEAQRAKNTLPPPPPPGPKLADSSLADTVNETLHVMAQEAKKVAVQASAAAQEAIAHAQAHQARQAAEQARHAAKQARKASRARPQHRRHGGGFWPLLIAAGCIGYAVFSANNGLLIGSDHANVTYLGNRGAAVVLGDHDNITLGGNCGTLTVLGDHDTITVTGTVKHIIAPGDHNTIQWTQPAGGPSPSIEDYGDGNSIQPAPGVNPLPSVPSSPAQ